MYQPLLKKYLISFLLFLLHNIFYGQQVEFTINLSSTAQTIDNIGASGAWYSEGIGKYWPEEKKERMAELLFSKSFDASGNPLGIGLSAWRFNIGGGTYEQGDSSGIRNPAQRVECFLSPDGTYDWNKQSGYIWFVKKAKDYGVEKLIAFSNTPPVQFTKNCLGFKLERDYKTNLKEDKYDSYAEFLVNVLKHFKNKGLNFNYICPVNEPQWDWSGRMGQMKQEGSPWVNKDIYHITVALDSALRANKLYTKILFPEAGILTALYGGNGHASRQIQNFYDAASPYSVKKLKTVLPIVAGHSYFTDNGDPNIIKIRNQLRDTALKYNIGFWQSEYCMLGDGYKERRSGRIPVIDCALFLAKMIHYDFTVANASAWQFWNAWEPGNPDFDVRYHLIVLKTNRLNTEGDFTITKNLWALGHYSRFIRPGMQRIITTRNDGKDELAAAQDIMLSAFYNKYELVVVVINYTETEKKIDLKIPAVKIKKIKRYTTTAIKGDDMRFYPLASINNIVLSARSISTIVLQIE